MRLFRRKKLRPASPRQEELAAKVAGGIIKAQQRLAGCLNHKAAELSGKSRLLLLILFCLLFAAANIYLLIHSI